jgi:hypothetical protein
MGNHHNVNNTSSYVIRARVTMHGYQPSRDETFKHTLQSHAPHTRMKNGGGGGGGGNHVPRSVMLRHFEFPPPPIHHAKPMHVGAVAQASKHSLSVDGEIVESHALSTNTVDSWRVDPSPNPCPATEKGGRVCASELLSFFEKTCAIV